MSIVEAIQQWSVGIPDWQQDAIARLFFKGKLDANDYAELYSLLKSSQGIAAPNGLTAKKLSAAQVPAAGTKGTQVELVAIKNLENVNAIASGQILPVAQHGLTVIYGANGAGKSGYSRVLKKACRARDQSELILPDARLQVIDTKRARASFDLLVNGSAVEVTWIDGQPAPSELASIATFDAHCARAYIDEQSDFSYVPYGLDILENLAKACNQLKVMLDAEHTKSAPNLMPFSALAATATQVGKKLASLSTNPAMDALAELAKLSEAELLRHQVIEQSLKEGNPKEKAQQLRLRSGRLQKFAERCSEKLTRVGGAETQKLRALVDATSAAKAAAELAAQKFKETPGQLTGTGGDAWQELFAAARKFASESHAAHTFPNLPTESLCPLCQQPLGDAVHRLVAFDHFVQQEVEKTARTKRAEAKEAFEVLTAADLAIHFDANIKTELEALDASLAEQCDKLQAAIENRRAAIKAACGVNGDWTELDAPLSDPCASLHALKDKLLAEAIAMEKVTDEKARAAMECEFKELDARKQLVTLIPTVVDAASKLQLQKKLKACELHVKTNAISLKSTELAEKVVSKELADALNAEFAKLNVDHLHVALKPVTAKGKTLQKLVIKLPGEAVPRDILSEGEQRAIAIASFLAEMTVNGGKGGAIFDDPMSSLDHRRRELIAKRLVDEATKRQIVVFTHDLFFLSLLQKESKIVSAPISSLSLRRTAEGFGVVSDSLPFDGANTKTRVGMLKEMLGQCVKLHKANEEEAYAKLAEDTYQRLRRTWERAIEEVLLNGVVWRFGANVATQSLREVAVNDADYAAINAGMTQCSKYAHDGAANAIVSIPTPDALEKDIEALDVWRVATIERRKQLIKDRPK